MNGFAGLKKPRKQKQGTIGLKERALNLWKECAGLVVGWDAVIGSKGARRLILTTARRGIYAIQQNLKTLLLLEKYAFNRYW